MKSTCGFPHIVVKVGGSLFRHQEAFLQVVDWINSHKDSLLVIVCGGGELADVVRRLDRELELGDSLAHELAMQTMRLNLSILCSRFENSRIATTIDEIHASTNRSSPAFFDVNSWRRTFQLGPHNWQTTSDSIAAALAVDSKASELVLLKPVGPEAGESADRVFASDLVDREFINWTVRLPAIRIVEVVKSTYREWSWTNKNHSCD